jgi:hypothetical protein
MIRYGNIKPERNAQMDLTHPFARNSLLCIPFIDWRTINVPKTLPSTGISNNIRPPTQVDYVQGGAPIRTKNYRGGAGRCPLDNGASNASWRISASNNWLPLTTCTVLLIRTKLDTTNRSVQVMQATQAGTAFWILCPWNTGDTFWDFGGNGGANRLQVTLTYSTTIPDIQIFTAGPNGSAIWHNGVKVASQGTAITRTVSGDECFLNASSSGSGGSGDFCDYNWFQIINDQWSDDWCAWWSAEPYAHLYTEASRSYFFLSGTLEVTSTMAITGPASLLSLVGAFTPNAYAIVSPAGAVNPYVRCFRF